MRQTCEYKFLCFITRPSQASCFRSSYQHLTQKLPPAFCPPGADASSFGVFERSQFVGRAAFDYFTTAAFQLLLCSSRLPAAAAFIASCSFFPTIFYFCSFRRARGCFYSFYAYIYWVQGLFELTSTSHVTSISIPTQRRCLAHWNLIYTYIHL